MQKEKAIRYIDKWRENRKNVRFIDLLQVASAFGFKFKGRKGSHVVYSRCDLKKILTFQDEGGKAKPYQVKQLIDLVDKYNLAEAEPDV